VLCGIPGDARYEPTYFGGFDKKMVSSIGAPDNVAFDSRGNLWIATDGQPSAIGWNDGIFAMPVDGDDRGYLRQLMSAPNGSEVCGPEFTPDDTTLFCAIQHPGEGGVLGGTTVSTWPDGPGQPPKPALIALTKTTGSPLIGN
jgi:secreted PhoX family phosphatase